MIHTLEGEVSSQQLDINLIDLKRSGEKRYQKIIQELYPVGLNPKEPEYKHACVLIQVLDGVESEMIRNQNGLADGRPKNDLQRLVDEQKEKMYALADEIFTLSKMAEPLKKRHHRQRR